MGNCQGKDLNLTTKAGYLHRHVASMVKQPVREPPVRVALTKGGISARFGRRQL